MFNLYPSGFNSPEPNETNCGSGLAAQKFLADQQIEEHKQERIREDAEFSRLTPLEQSQLEEKLAAVRVAVQEMGRFLPISVLLGANVEQLNFIGPYRDTFSLKAALKEDVSGSTSGLLVLVERCSSRGQPIFDPQAVIQCSDILEGARKIFGLLAQWETKHLSRTFHQKLTAALGGFDHEAAFAQPTYDFESLGGRLGSLIFSVLFAPSGIVQRGLAALPFPIAAQDEQRRTEMRNALLRSFNKPGGHELAAFEGFVGNSGPYSWLGKSRISDI